MRSGLSSGTSPQALRAVNRFADHFDIFSGFKDEAQPLTDDEMVVGDQHADHHDLPFSLSSRRVSDPVMVLQGSAVADRL